MFLVIAYLLICVTYMAFSFLLSPVDVLVWTFDSSCLNMVLVFLARYFGVTNDYLLVTICTVVYLCAPYLRITLKLEKEGD